MGTLDVNCASSCSIWPIFRPNLQLELLQILWIEVQLPLQITTHLPLHLIDLLQCKHSLPDDTPRLVRICVVADDLAGDHGRGEEEAGAQWATGSGEAVLEAVEEREHSEGDRDVQAGAMEGVRDEVREGRGDGGCRRGERGTGTLLAPGADGGGCEGGGRVSVQLTGGTLGA